MQRRIKMNSASLQEAFPEVYREFFSKCSIVTSASGGFWFAGEYAVLEGGLSITQKVPMRFYVGIIPTKKPGIVDLGGYEFVPSTQEFKPVDFNYWWQATKNIFNDFLQRELENSLPDGDHRGFQFTYITEIPTSAGLNASAALSAAMANAFLVYTKKLTPEIIEQWNTKKSSELVKDPLFNQAFRFAWKLEAILQGGFSSGSAVFACFINSIYPIIYFSEKRKKKNNLLEGGHFPAYNFQTIGIFDKINYQGFNFEELEPDISGDWPFDFGLIYSGDFVRTSAVIRSLPAFEEHLKRVRATIKEKIGLAVKKWSEDSALVSIIKNPQEMRDSYIRSINSIAVRVFYHLLHTFRSGATEERFTKLAENINIHQDSLRIFNISSSRLDFICDFLVHEGNKLGESVGCKISGSGKKGDLLFIAPFNGLRDEIWNIISRLQRETNENIFLDYACWLDGIGSQGIVLEQNVNVGIFSPIISSGTTEVCQLTPSGELISSLYTFEKFEKERNSFDLLLDTLEEDIYIRGRKLTSKDIKTARETVAVLKILIENLDKFVPSSSFSRSSYAADRGEFQSKIVSPINKVLEKEIGKKIPLIISGNIVDFSVKLRPGINIYMVKKRF